MRDHLKFNATIVIVSISFIQNLQFCVTPVLGQIQEHFPGTDVTLIQTLVTIPSITSVIFALLTGWMVKTNKKKLLLFAGLVAGITGFIPFLRDNLGLLFLTSILYGVSKGLFTALNVSIVAEFFKGDERVSLMGIQSASIGAGMVFVTMMGGFLGIFEFRYAYFVHTISFIVCILIALCLPDTGKGKDVDSNLVAEKIKLNRQVLKLSFWGFLEFFFLMTFSTNIAMHLSGSNVGGSGISGIFMGIFSGSQMVIGMLLGFMVKLLKKYTLPAAMLSFSAGAVILVCFPSHKAFLIVGAMLCGFSQGIFVPKSLVDISNAVNHTSVPMAAAFYTCCMSLGQVISPMAINNLSNILFGEITTRHVYILAAVGMALTALLVVLPGVTQRQPSHNRISDIES